MRILSRNFAAGIGERTRPRVHPIGALADWLTTLAAR